jgi:hypothetical protein
MPTEAPLKPRGAGGPRAGSPTRDFVPWPVNSIPTRARSPRPGERVTPLYDRLQDPEAIFGDGREQRTAPGASTTAADCRAGVGEARALLSALKVLDAAIDASGSARDESSRVLDEVLAGVERSFAPNDEKRQVVRAYFVMLGRAGGRLRSSSSWLEEKAAEALKLATDECGRLRARIEQLEARLRELGEPEPEPVVPEPEQVPVDDGSVERRIRAMKAEIDRLERLRRQLEEMIEALRAEIARLIAELERVNGALEASRQESSALLARLAEQERAFVAELEALRTELSSTAEELRVSRKSHEEDVEYMKAQLQLKDVQLKDITSRMRCDLTYMTGLASETQTRLEERLAEERAEREETVGQLCGELERTREAYAVETARLSEALAASEREKQAMQVEMTEQLRVQRQTFEAEAAGLRGKIARHRSVQREALDAGIVRGRKILYWDYVKGDGSESSLTWRSAHAKLREPSQIGAHGHALQAAGLAASAASFVSPPPPVVEHFGCGLHETW